MGITPSNNPGTERELLPLYGREFPNVALYGHDETDLIQRIDAMKSTYYHPYEYFG